MEGLKDGSQSVIILWTLAKPYIIPGLEPEDLKSLYCSMKISLLVSKIFKVFKLLKILPST